MKQLTSEEKDLKIVNALHKKYAKATRENPIVCLGKYRNTLYIIDFYATYKTIKKVYLLDNIDTYFKIKTYSNGKRSSTTYHGKASFDRLLENQSDVLIIGKTQVPINLRFVSRKNYNKLFDIQKELATICHYFKATRGSVLSGKCLLETYDGYQKEPLDLKNPIIKNTLLQWLHFTAGAVPYCNSWHISLVRVIKYFPRLKEFGLERVKKYFPSATKREEAVIDLCMWLKGFEYRGLSFPINKFAWFFNQKLTNEYDLNRYYSDYLHLRATLINLALIDSKDYSIFPNNIKAKHDQLITLHTNHTERIRKLQTIEASKAYQTLYPELSKLDYSEHDLQIFACKHIEDLLDEGKALQHCVGSYINSVAKGNQAIYFLRKTKDLDTPYYTVDVAKGKIRQVHGKCNCNATEEIKLFIDRWAKKFNLDIANYSSICCAIH